MRASRAFATLVGLCLVSGSVLAQSGAELSCKPLKEFFKSKRQKAKEQNANLKKPSGKEWKYQDLVGKATTSDGLIRTLLTKDGKLFFELNDSVMGKPLLISNRISSTSNNQDFVAGQMIDDPFMIKFGKSDDDDNVYLYAVDPESFVDETDPIAPSFHKNYIDPILRAFRVEAVNGKNVVIDVTSFFQGGEAALSPLKRKSKLPSMPLMGATHFTHVKSFPKNVEVKCMLGFKDQDGMPYTIETHRSIVLLPEHPMAMRLQDNRVGYFYSSRQRFTTDQDKIDRFKVISRWRLEPKDSAAYFRGELVEPVKPIVYYVDTVFPAKWKKAVMAGVQDWNKAFEAAGFKNAVVVREYPSKAENPDFDPDDMRFSCIKYATTAIANAMGPSYIDPRSGEILNADVIWYHNVVSLLYNWRFVQTAAVDARVRATSLPDEVMAHAMRYVASHEIGHTLGLMHNMGASYALPVDSLRDPAFTQKYGTTPSIMDYARNNFVAQPGDLERGVRLTPPLVGVYDVYAINWGYRLIPGAKTYKDEKATLDKWIAEKANDPKYAFGAQQINTLDPTAQTEDLGNDHIKAGNYAIANLKIIKANYEKWLLKKGDRTDDLESMHKQIISQFMRHLRHVTPYIGGRVYFENRQGDGKMPVSYISKAKQKEALAWVVKQVRDMPNWLLTNADKQKYDQSGSVFGATFYSTLPALCLSELMEGYRFKGIVDGYQAAQGGTGYSLAEYIDDYAKEVFQDSYAGKALTPASMQIEDAALRMLLMQVKPKSESHRRSSFPLDELRKELAQDDDALLCGNQCEHNMESEKPANEFFRMNALPDAPSSFERDPILLSKVKDLRALYKRRAATAKDKATKRYYDYWEFQFKEAFDK